MSDLDHHRQRFEKRLDELAGKSSEDPSLDSDILGRLHEWEIRLDRRLAEFHSEPPPEGQAEAHPETQLSPSTRPRPHKPFADHNAALQSGLEDLEHMMLEELELCRYQQPDGFKKPIQIVAGDQAMRQAIAEATGWGDSDSLPVEGHHLGAFHYPGHGTLVNREHYERAHAARTLSSEAPHVTAHVIGESAVERWGWGYLLEYTSLGRLAGRRGLWPALSRARLGLPAGDASSAAAASELCQIWLFTQAGWLDWVWQYVMFKARHPLGANLFHRPRPARLMELLVKIIDLFPLYLTPFGVRLRLRNLLDLVKFLFLEESEAVPDTLNQVMLKMQQFCLENDARVVQYLDQPLSLMLGRFSFSLMEANVGILAMPYAVLVASHVNHLDLQPGEVLRQASADPRRNPDTRLAMLSRLDARVKYDPRAMFTAAWERLKLEGPSEYF